MKKTFTALCEWKWNGTSDCEEDMFAIKLEADSAKEAAKNASIFLLQNKGGRCSAKMVIEGTPCIYCDYDEEMTSEEVYHDPSGNPEFIHPWKHEDF